MADGWMFIPVAVSIHMIGQWLTFLNCNWSTVTTSYVGWQVGHITIDMMAMGCVVWCVSSVSGNTLI